MASRQATSTSLTWGGGFRCVDDRMLWSSRLPHQPDPGKSPRYRRLVAMRVADA
jgi:hypothetical protein